MVKLLLKESGNIDINAIDEKGRSGFHWACQRGHVKLVQLFLQESHRIKIDIDATDNDRKSAYELASEYGHSDVEKLLSKRFNK